MKVKHVSAVAAVEDLKRDMLRIGKVCQSHTQLVDALRRLTKVGQAIEAGQRVPQGQLDVALRLAEAALYEAGAANKLGEL